MRSCRGRSESVPAPVRPAPKGDAGGPSENEPDPDETLQIKTVLRHSPRRHRLPVRGRRFLRSEGHRVSSGFLPVNGLLRCCATDLILRRGRSLSRSGTVLHRAGSCRLGTVFRNLRIREVFP